MSRTSEWVSPGHPDKIADNISEYILDRYLEKDSNVRYALEVMIKNNTVILGGEVSSTNNFTDNQLESFVKEAISSIGYNEDYNNVWGDNAININKIKVLSLISTQSPNIADGVNNNGWGDQGIFYGYAENNPSTNYMPADIFYAKSIGTKLYKKALSIIDKSIGLDIKTQVTVNNNDEIEKVIIAVPCQDNNKDNVKNIITDIINEYPHISNYSLIINGTGTYIIHSSIGDCGITGRKLAVDFYGGNCQIGGGSPWTKDASKADLTLNFLMRQYALKELKESNNPNIHHVIVFTNSCIGKFNCDIKYEFFDKSNNNLYTLYDNRNIYPNEVIKEYNLNKPIFFNLCKNGLFE